MKIAVLTSSRADYGIYLPLLKALKNDPFFDLRLLVFGTHLSAFHGHTIDAITRDGFVIDHSVEHIQDSDSAEAIGKSMAIAMKRFTDIWGIEKKNYDLVFCLGDRYEMFAAVSAAAPFRIRFAHIHGGETTLGAIDNEFRHAITVFSSLHFTTTEAYSKRVAEIKGSSDQVYTVGSLSLENLRDFQFFSQKEFLNEFGIDLSKSSLLVTYHPETVAEEKNEQNAKELVIALGHFKNRQIIITMPNADTMGNTMRSVYRRFAEENTNVILVENFGTRGYFTCMNSADFVLGNSSSGIIEAASFGKYVVNIGDRQKGRAASENMIQSKTDSSSIIAACEEAERKGIYTGRNIYQGEHVVQKITDILKKWKP